MTPIPSVRCFRSFFRPYTGTRATFRRPHAQLGHFQLPFSMARVPCLRFQMAFSLEGVLEDLSTGKWNKRRAALTNAQREVVAIDCALSASPLLHGVRVKTAGKGFSRRATNHRRCRFLAARCLRTWRRTGWGDKSSVKFPVDLPPYFPIIGRRNAQE